MRAQAGAVDRVDAGQLSHPRQLALDICEVTALEQRPGLRQVDLAREMGRDLLEAHRLARGARCAALERGLDLREDLPLQHAGGTAADPLPDLPAIHDD